MSFNKELKMSTKATLEISGLSLRAKINFYKKRAKEIEEYLSKRPNEWGRFQSEFNSEVNNVFREIMNFERENIDSGGENKVYKLKRFFVEKIRKTFERGSLTAWILEKPYGYAGDFKIINDIYENAPDSIGFDRLFDNYAYRMGASIVTVESVATSFRC